MGDPDTDELRAEVAEIASALRSYVEWQRESGAVGLPRDPDAREKAARALEALATSDESQGLAPDESQGKESDAPERQLKAPAANPVSFAERRPAPLPPETVKPVAQGAGESPLLPVIRDDLPGTLDELAASVRDCTACGLAETRRNTVFARGSGISGLCFVGEGPGADEDAAGSPFVGQAGQLLDKMIAAMGFSRDDVYVMNIVKCRPPDNRKPSAQEMAACSGYLHRQLELLQPEIIVALGATAVEGLLGQSGGITKIRGRFRLYRGRTAVMPTFHPAYLLRTPKAKRDVWNDLRQVVEHMGRTLPGEG